MRLALFLMIALLLAVEQDGSRDDVLRNLGWMGWGWHCDELDPSQQKTCWQDGNSKHGRGRSFSIMRILHPFVGPESQAPVPIKQ